MNPSDPGHPLPTTPVAPAPPPAGFAPPPFYPSPQPPRRDRAATWVVAFIFGGLFLVFFAFLALAYSAVKGDSGGMSIGGPRVGVIEVKGQIGIGGRAGVESEDVLKVVKRFSEDSDMKAVVVRVDSPGGAVAPSQEMFDEIKKLAKKKKVVCSMGNVAASGGFYISMACEKIVAEPGTLTGSIGVISQFPNFTALATKYDFKMETVKSGKLKDAGNPFREMTPDDRAYWQSMIDRVYKQFVKAVAESRKLPEAKVREFADGRVLTGDQALELGLIDQLGNFHDAVDLVASMANLKGEPHLIYPPEERAKLFESMLGGVVHGIAEEVRAEVRAETSPGRPGLYFMTFLGQ